MDLAIGVRNYLVPRWLQEFAVRPEPCVGTLNVLSKLARQPLSLIFPVNHCVEELSLPTDCAGPVEWQIR